MIKENILIILTIISVIALPLGIYLRIPPTSLALALFAASLIAVGSGAVLASMVLAFVMYKNRPTPHDKTHLITIRVLIKKRLPSTTDDKNRKKQLLPSHLPSNSNNLQLQQHTNQDKPQEKKDTHMEERTPDNSLPGSKR